MTRSVVIASGVLLLLVASGPAAVGTSARPDTSVREQNLDSEGFIAVHEQGVADTNVTNLPTDAAGALRTVVEGGITGSVKAEVSGTVDAQVSGTVGVDPSANEVSLDPAVQTALDAILAELAALQFDAGGNLRVTTSDLPPATDGVFGLIRDSTAPTGEVSLGGGGDELVVGMSFVANTDAEIRFVRGSGADVEAVRVVFAKANEAVTLDFSHPVLADRVRITCGPGCVLSAHFSAL